MCALSLSKVQYYLNKHPYATVDELRAYVAKQSKGKNVNRKEYDKVMRFLNEREAAAATVATMDPANVSPKAQEAIDRINKQQAGVKPKKEAPVTQPYISSKEAKEIKRQENLAHNAEKRAAAKERKALTNENIILRDKAMEQAYKAEQLHSEVKLDAARSEFWQKEMEAAFGKENVNAAATTAGVPKERALTVRGKGKSPEQILKEAENELRQASQIENATHKFEIPWKTQLNEAVESGKLQLVPNEAPKMPTGAAGAENTRALSTVLERGAETTSNATRRIGKKGWIGIGIAAIALLTGFIIRHNHKKKAQNLNVNA